MCNVSLLSLIHALIIVFLESLWSLHIFATLCNILLVGGSRKSNRWFKIPDSSGDKSFFLTKMDCL